ncbi:UNVERIFIED_CONTAM: Exocyst complex component SEC10b [Sesamum radiatum]|uniref:Exocyst complex component SEC10b n=1 Tax=Sesamum radiatum TaxID=300843 RepID=A0AAW2MTT3_SESRA
MSTAMSRAEATAYKGLQQCIETVTAEVERLLSAEQKATDYRSPDDGFVPDHRPTNACTRVVAYLSRALEAAFTSLEGLNKQAFLTELVWRFPLKQLSFDCSHGSEEVTCQSFSYLTLTCLTFLWKQLAVT